MPALNDILVGKTDSHITWLSDKVGVHKQMLPAFEKLQRAAHADGIEVLIASGFRSFERQLMIWQNKFSGKIAIKDKSGNVLDATQLSDADKIHAIMLFSALPGASRHHWGSDIDIYAPNLLPHNSQLQLEPWEYQENGPFYPLTVWLAEHAHQFGFYFPYDKYRGGVAKEPWHMSYIPLSTQFQKHYKLPLVENAIAKSNISGKDLIIEMLPDLFQQYIVNVSQY